LTLSDELVLSADDCLKEPQIFGVSSMDFNAVNKMLDDFLVNFIAKRQIVFENCTDCLGVEIARVEEQVKLLVKEHLIMLVAKTEVLEELMSQLHQLIHSRVILLVVRNL
jgi:ribosomal protein L10